MNRPLPSSPAAIPDEDQLLADLLEQWTMQLQSGEVIDWQASARDYPQYTEQLRDLLPALQALAGIGEKSAAAVSVKASGACERPGSSLEAGCSHTPLAPTTPIGVLGDYRLLREVGRGGMGTVYEAEQISLHRRVALKVLPFAAALDVRQLQRFKTEAQAAAQLHHSNIVPVFAVGCEQGVHYYAMQFIEGQTLAQLIGELRAEKEERGLKIEDRESGMEDGGSKKSEIEKSGTTVDHRAEATRFSNGHPRSAIFDPRSSFFRMVADLGIQAAEALEYAHQMAVVHRDIKPANLLIDSSPLPTHPSRLHLWITDFGLARYQTDAGLTGTGDVLGTVRYMSPEQAQGHRGIVDHRSDVYALGATLYELVTLRPAFDGHSREEILAQLATEEPVAPCRLNRTIPVELETIVLKALAKRPEERYASAQELADDLRRFLEDKPILARRPSLVEKYRKWVRRHKGLMRGAAGMAGLAVVGLILSTVMIARERHETEMRRRQARRAVDEMYSQFAESMLSRQPGMELLEEEFLLKALRFYQEFSREESADPELRFETAKAFRRMGDIYYKLGQLDEAKGAFEEAASRLQLPRRTDFKSVPPDYRRELALTENNRANIFRDEGRMSEAGQGYRQAERLLELPERGDQDSSISLDSYDCLAGIESNLGIALTALGRPKEAEQAYRKALVLLDKLSADHAASPGYRHDFAGCLNNLGNLLTAAGRFAEAEKFLGQALEIRDQLASDFPTFPAYHQALAVSHTSFGALLAARSRYAEATQHYRQGRAILEKLAKDFPATPSYRYGLASNAVGLGCVLTATGQFKPAEENHRQALALRETLATDYPRAISSRQELAASHAGLGQLAFLTGKYAEAERAFRQALMIRQKLTADAAGIPRYGHELRASHHQLANLLTCLGRLSEAESHYRQGIGLQRSDASMAADVFDKLEMAACQSDLAALLFGLGRQREAEAELRHSLESLQSRMEECPEMGPIRLFMCVGLDRLALVYQHTSRKADAEKSLLLALAMAEKLKLEMPANPDFRRQHAHLQIRLGERLSAGRTDFKSVPQAEEALAKGMTFMAKLADDYPAVPECRRELAQGLDLLGCFLMNLKKATEAAKVFPQVRQLREQLAREFPEMPWHWQEMAWFLATCPDESFRNPKVALQMAERAVALAREQGECWSALGVAQYRSGEWKKAQEALQEAIKLRSGGGCAEWLFLAMTCQQLSDPGQARQWFDKAAAWIDQNQPISEELTRFHAEAEAVMTKGARSAQLPIGVGGR